VSAVDDLQCCVSMLEQSWAMAALDVRCVVAMIFGIWVLTRGGVLCEC